MRDRSIEIDRHGSGRGGVVRCVEAAAAIQRVGTPAPPERIVAASAEQHLGGGATGQGVAKVRPLEYLDVENRVAQSFAAGAQRPGQADRDRRCRCEIADRIGPAAAVDRIAAIAANQKVVARAALQRIRAEPARQAVIARAAHQRVIAAAAGEHVDICRTDHPLDPGQRIALGIAAAGGRTIERHSHAARRGTVVRRIETKPAIEHIGPGTAAQYVVVRAADQDIAAAIAGQDVRSSSALKRFRERAARDPIGKGRADHPLHADQRIALGIAAISRRSIERKVYRSRARRIICGIEAAPPFERVRARAAGERVVARSAAQRIVSSPARKRVVACAADQSLVRTATAQDIIEIRGSDLFDSAQRIALRVAAAAGSGQQIDRHRARRRRIRHRVEAAAAIERIGSRAAIERIVTLPAAQDIIARRARQDVVASAAVEGFGPDPTGQAVIEGRTDHALDAGERIARRITARTLRAARGNRHPGARCGIIRRIVTRPADQRIAADRSSEHVVTRAAIERLVLDAAQQHVAQARADHRLDAAQRIALGIATLTRRAIDTHHDRCRRCRIIGNVGAFAADEAIGARRADQAIIAQPAGKGFIAGAAAQRIVEIRSYQRFDADQHIALCRASRARAAIETGGDTAGRIGIAGGVDPRAAFKPVRAIAACEQVVAVAAAQQIGPDVTVKPVIARAAVHRIGSDAAIDRIVARRTDRGLEAGQDVACRIAANAAATIEIDRHRSARRRITDRIEAGAAIERVRTRAAQHGVIAGSRPNRFRAAPAAQLIGKRRTDKLLNIAERIAQRFAGRARRAGQIDSHAAGGKRVAGGIEAAATVERIRADPAAEHIVTIAAEQCIVRNAAGQRVGKARTDHPLDADQAIAFGVAAGRKTAVERDSDARQRCLVAGGIEADPAVDLVGARAADQGIVAGAAQQPVAAAAAKYSVVAAAAAQRFVADRAREHVGKCRSAYIFDAGQGITLRVAARRQGAVQIDRHAGRRGRVIDRIAACATIDGVCAAAAVQCVVALAAGQDIVTRAAVQRIIAHVAAQIIGEGRTRYRVVKRRAFDDLDAREHVARRIAAGAAIGKAQADRRAAQREIGRVDPSAAIQRIRSCAAAQQIIAKTAAQRFIACRSDQSIGKV